VRLVGVLVIAFLLAACGLSQAPAGSNSSGKIQVVAVENFWGSIAAQIGGEHASVTSIISNPDSDPHDYDPTPQDARTIAQANYVIVNGVGYDGWAIKLVAANPVSGRRILNIGEMLGKKDGDNPHLWYSPEYVGQVVDRIAGDLGQLDNSDAAALYQQGEDYKNKGLKAYHDTIGAIKQKYTGTKVGATESIFTYLAEGTGLDLITPPGYLNAISEGADPSAADKATVESQIATRAIKVFVYNSQNSTPEVQGLVAKARAKTIPVVSVAETMLPAGATFQDWQTAQLNRLLQALGA